MFKEGIMTAVGLDGKKVSSNQNPSPQSVGKNGGREFNPTGQNPAMQELFDNTTALLRTPEGTTFNLNLQVQKEESLDEEFVRKFNSLHDHAGIKYYTDWAMRFLLEKQIEGGLIPTDNNRIQINIPNARQGLYFLICLRAAQAKSIKMRALDNLIEILKKDPLTEASASGLLQLSINLMKQLDQEFQTETITVQIKIGLVYGLLADLILRHYREGNVNAIEDDLKMQLTKTLEGFDKINTQNHPALSYYVKYAREGFKRLQSDINVFCLAFNTITGTLDGLGMAYKGSIAKGATAVVGAVIDLARRKNEDWFNHAFVFHTLSKEAEKDINQLNQLIYLYEKKRFENWKYTYSYLESLGWLVLLGSTLEIRNEAYKHLREFQTCTQFTEKTSLKPLVQAKKPKKININAIVQIFCLIWIGKIAERRLDLSIRSDAIRSLHKFYMREIDLPTISDNNNLYESELISRLKKKLMKNLEPFFSNYKKQSLTDDELNQIALKLDRENFLNEFENLNEAPSADPIEKKRTINPEKEFTTIEASKIGTQPGFYVLAACLAQSCSNSQEGEWVQCADREIFEMHEIEATLKCSCCHHAIDVKKMAIVEREATMEYIDEHEITGKRNFRKKTGLADVITLQMPLGYLKFKLS